MEQDKKDLEIGNVVSRLDFAHGVFKVIAQAVKAEGGNTQHLRRLVSDGNLQQEIAKLIMLTTEEMSPPLREDEYLVYVDYDMPRDKTELEAEFSKGGVSDIFCGDAEWEKHASCVQSDEMPGDRVFLPKHFNRKIESEEAIVKMGKLGYRPATRLEAFAFIKARPKLPGQPPIVALGSSTMCHDAKRQGAHVVLLSEDFQGNFLSSVLFDSIWGFETVLLFVRKDT